MNINLNALKDFEALDIGGQLLIKLPQYHSNLYKIGDNEPRTLSGGVIVEKGVDVSKVIVGSKFITHYEKDGQKLAKEEFESIAYENRKKYLDEDGDVTYPSLDVEYECRKNLEQIVGYRAVYDKEDDKFEPLEITVKGVIENSDSEFINSSLSFGQATFTDAKLYQLNETGVVTKAFWDFIEKHQLKDRTVNDGISFRNYVRFAKVDGNFIMTDSGILGIEEKKSSYHTSLKEAEDREKYLTNLVKEHLQFKLFGGKEVLDGVQKGVIYDDLESLERMVRNVEPKQKGMSNYRNSLAKINEIKKKIKGE